MQKMGFNMKSYKNIIKYSVRWTRNEINKQITVGTGKEETTKLSIKMNVINVSFNRPC